jgi:hypothetical protein
MELDNLVRGQIHFDREVLKQRLKLRHHAFLADRVVMGQISAARFGLRTT